MTHENPQDTSGFDRGLRAITTSSSARSAHLSMNTEHLGGPESARQRCASAPVSYLATGNPPAMVRIASFILGRGRSGFRAGQRTAYWEARVARTGFAWENGLVSSCRGFPGSRHRDAEATDRDGGSWPGQTRRGRPIQPPSHSGPRTWLRTPSAARAGFPPARDRSTPRVPGRRSLASCKRLGSRARPRPHLWTW
jgi:hypothetical protein